MAKTVLIDELHLTVRVPAGLSATQARAVRRTLFGAAFMTRLRAAIRRAVRASPDLVPCRLSLGR